MAAVSHSSIGRVVDLREFSAEDLNPVLEEERASWRSALSWDFTPSAELVRRFVSIRALNGHALILDGRIIGYSYHVREERKALIGDLYVMRRFASGENERLLLEAGLKSLMELPYLHRIEAQLMMLQGGLARNLPYARQLNLEPREFMLADLDRVDQLPRGSAARDWEFPLWTDDRHDEAAALITRAYRGHIDSTINDQYRSFQGAQRFLTNIVQYPGCGTFFCPASFCAVDSSGRMGGISLGSLVASDVGHITQICVLPEVQGTGLGYELIRRSLVSFAEHGCEKASLTVTSSNAQAIKLYQRVGYRSTRRFAAYVWEGF
ncbi:MAG TPA: N-acetyltransferase [Bryobacteraceae bacterium]|nr:N-acetyltransferase [Bryobacteraceae bacterium]